MKIERIDPFLRPELVAAIVSAYQQTFGDTPWNEGYKCPICSFTTALNQLSLHCPRCHERGKSILMVEYWPSHQILSDFYQEILRPDSLCLVAKEEEKVVGFTWGYQITIHPQIDGHLEAPGLHELVSGEFFYLDEVAVLPTHQRKGIGKKLIQFIFATQPHPKIILRTLDDSQMSRLINCLGGKTIMPISRDRVIMSLDWPDKTA